MRIESWTAQQSEAIATAARNLDDHHSHTSGAWSVGHTTTVNLGTFQC